MGVPRARQRPGTAPTLALRAKKIPTDKGWDFKLWWCAGNRRQTAHELLMRANVGECGLARVKALQAHPKPAKLT